MWLKQIVRGSITIPIYKWKKWKHRKLLNCGATVGTKKIWLWVQRFYMLPGNISGHKNLNSRLINIFPAESCPNNNTVFLFTPIPFLHRKAPFTHVRHAMLQLNWLHFIYMLYSTFLILRIFVSLNQLVKPFVHPGNIFINNSLKPYVFIPIYSNIHRL